MPDTHVSFPVPLLQTDAWNIYINEINTWWPRQGVFPYSFAPKVTKPNRIDFKDGQYIETFMDGSTYVIGTVKTWEPPALIVYTWQDPTWADHTTIEVIFQSTDSSTTVTYQQNGFESAGVAYLIPYYQIGNKQTMAAYRAHCQAVFELSQLEQT